MNRPIFGQRESQKPSTMTVPYKEFDPKMFGFQEEPKTLEQDLQKYKYENQDLKTQISALSNEIRNAQGVQQESKLMQQEYSKLKVDSEQSKRVEEENKELK